MEEREKIHNSLQSKKMLATLSEEELLSIAEDRDKFSQFISGIAYEINPYYVGHIYRHNNILQKMIGKVLKNELDLSDEDYDNALFVTKQLNDFGSKNSSFRMDFTYQYESIQAYLMGLDKLDISLNDMDKVLVDMFDKIDNGKIEEIKSNKYYLATVGYLLSNYSSYLLNSEILPEIKTSLTSIDKSSFANEKEYNSFKKVSSKMLRRIKNKTKIEKKQKEKVKKRTLN